MRVVCSACNTPYSIADEKVPQAGARVRCRKCRAVFTIPPREEREAPTSREGTQPSILESISPPPAAPRVSPAPAPPAGAPQPPHAPVPHTAEPARDAAPREIHPEPLPTIPPAGEPLEPPAPPARDVRLSEARAAMSPLPEGLSPEERAKHERARRLARVLASDIAIYNKEKCQRGTRDGNLVAVLGYEIKKSWEVYKERVTTELANSTPYFRDALNEMLGEGKKIF